MLQHMQSVCTMIQDCGKGYGSPALRVIQVVLLVFLSIQLLRKFHRIKMLEFITDRQIYRKVLCERVVKAQRFLWIATSDLKDLYMEKKGAMVPFLEILSDLTGRNVEIRLLHAKEPGKAFREDFDKYPNLINGMERILCPRVHLKTVIIDGEFAYTGSANLTGAGMGAKSEHKRNFEAGIITNERIIVGEIMEQFDSIWRGTHCSLCRRKKFCADYKDIMAERKL